MKIHAIHVMPHTEIFANLLEQIEVINFRERINKDKISHKHYLVTCIEAVLELAQKNDWGICQHNGEIFLYNGAFWSLIQNVEVQSFLGEAAEKLSVDTYDARYYQFRENLLKQFLSASNLSSPDITKDNVLINLRSGTFEISVDKQFLRSPKREDFLTYQLPFEFDTNSVAPIFSAFLDKVLPDIELQQVLAEYIASLFISNKKLKLEKTLLLYGHGANGKSVFFDIINALLGPENTSNFSLQHLTNENGYYRAKIANKLVNYASEISGSLETTLFKQLVSGEPVTARLPYGVPLTLFNYAKLIFNTNELPKEVENNYAFFRRFIIIPFTVTIPESKQDKELAQKIISRELSGVFNWVLEGMQRLLTQKNFTESHIVRQYVDDYRKQSDTVVMFIEDQGYNPTINEFMPLSPLYKEYQKHCTDTGTRYIALRTFSDRLKRLGFAVERKSSGNVVFIGNKVF